MKEKKIIAKSLFIRGSYSQKEIAELLGVSAQSISAWKEEGQWDLLRASEILSTEVLVNKTLLKLSEMIDSDQASLKELSVLWRIIRDIQDKEPSGMQVFEVFKKYNEWLLMHDLELAKANSLYQDKFMKEFYFE